MAYGYFATRDYATSYYLSGRYISTSNYVYKWGTEGDFTFYTTGDEYYYENRPFMPGRYIEESIKNYLPPGFYECKKSSFSYSRYDNRKNKYVTKDYPRIDLVAELTVGKETYKASSKGEYIATIGSSNKSDYPENDVKDGYWYELIK